MKRVPEKSEAMIKDMKRVTNHEQTAIGVSQISNVVTISGDYLVRDDESFNEGVQLKCTARLFCEKNGCKLRIWAAQTNTATVKKC
jgi:hypothetical protein